MQLWTLPLREEQITVYWCQRSFFYIYFLFLKKFWRMRALFVGPLKPLFWTSGNISCQFEGYTKLNYLHLCLHLLITLWTDRVKLKLKPKEEWVQFECTCCFGCDIMSFNVYCLKCHVRTRDGHMQSFEIDLLTVKRSGKDASFFTPSASQNTPVAWMCQSFCFVFGFFLGSSGNIANMVWNTCIQLLFK